MTNPAKKEVKNIAFYKMPIVIVIVLSIITFGVYYFFWFVIRIHKFNKLNSELKISKTAFVVCVITVLIQVMLLLIDFGLILLYWRTVNFSITELYSPVMLISLYLQYQIIKANRMINDHLNINEYSKTERSNLYSLWLGIIYLQHRININL